MIEEVGDGRKAKVIITERRWGRMKWIRFGVDGAKTLLKSVVALRTEADNNLERLGWCENDRRYSLEMRKNQYGRFLLCSVTDLDGRKHRLLFPEGNGLLNGWTLLEGALQDLGFREDRGERKGLTKNSSMEKEENQKGDLYPGRTMDIENHVRRRQESIWLDTRESCPQGDLGLLKYGIVGSWKVMPVTAQSLEEVEKWAKRDWKLEGSITIHPLNQNLFFMGFELPEEARWVMENGSRLCRGRVMQLEWWTPYSGCNGVREQENEVWIRVVGLPLHLWTGENLKKVGDNCGGFVALDEGTASKTDLFWARILVKLNSNVKPASVFLLMGASSYELQIWWEIRPTVEEVSPRSSRNFGSLTDSGEEDVRAARANGRVKFGWADTRYKYRGGLNKAVNQTELGSGKVVGRLSNSLSLGTSAKMGTRQRFEIQKGVGTKGRVGKHKRSVLMDSVKVSDGPHFTGGSAHVYGQIQRDFVGPSKVKIGEKSARPSERHYPDISRAACKGRIGCPTGMANPRCFGSKECEALVDEEKGLQETISLQGQGGSEEGDDAGNHCVEEKESQSGKILEKYPFGAEQEYDGGRDGPHPVADDLASNDRRDDIQAGEKFKQSSRDPGLKKVCLRVEEEGEEDKRSGRSVDSNGKGLGNIDGIRAAPSGREHLHSLEEKAVQSPVSGHSLGEGRGSDRGLEPNLDKCRAHGSSSGMGQNSRESQSLVSIKRASVNGITIFDPICFMAQTEIVKTGLNQELVLRAAETTRKLEPTSSIVEVGLERNNSSLGEADEIREAAAHAEGYNFKKRYDENFFSQSTSIPYSVFGRPLLLGGCSGPGDSSMEKALPLRVVAADGKEWGLECSGGTSEEGEETGVAGQRKEVQCESIENWNYGSWESSCLVKFSEFLGFPTKGFEKEILKLLRNLVASQKLSKEKGSLTVSKSERELRRLRSTINYNGNRINKGGGRDRGNLMLKLK